MDDKLMYNPQTLVKSWSWLEGGDIGLLKIANNLMNLSYYLSISGGNVWTLN